MKPIFEDKKSGIYVFRHDAFSFPEHVHPLSEIAIVLSGEIRMQIGSRAYTLSGGDIGAVFSHVTHGYDGGEGSFILILFPPGISQDYGHALANRAPAEPVLRASQLDGEVMNAARMILIEHEKGGREELVKAYIQVLLARVMPLYALEDTRAAESDGLAYRMMRLISREYARDISLTSLSAALRVSPFHLSHVFASKFHTHFREYVNALRVDRARILLKSTDAPVTEICYECGFENQRTFNRAFRKLTGLTPTEYRRK